MFSCPNVLEEANYSTLTFVLAYGKALVGVFHRNIELLRQPFNHRFENLITSGSSPLSRLFSLKEWRISLALAKKSFIGSCPSKGMWSSIKYSNKLFLTCTVLVGAPAPATRKWFLEQFPSISNFLFSSNSTERVVNLEAFLKSFQSLGSSFRSEKNSLTVGTT